MKKGITFIEIILVIAVSVFLAAIVFFKFSDLNSRQALEKDALSVASVLNEARSRTLSSKGATQYGVHLEESRVVLFPGNSYSAGNSLNEPTDLSAHTHISDIDLIGGVDDIVFSRLTGAASASGTTTISLRNNPSSMKTIVIHGTGIIQSN